MIARGGRRPHLFLALAVAATLLAATCVTPRLPVGPVVTEPPEYPPTVFAVMSDLHVYDRDLGDTGTAFEAYLRNDRKLLVESVEILDAALRQVDETDARFLLVAGDLTKDGEESSHRIVVDYLAAMERTGRQVWVVPGNHDVLNPDAMRFVGERTEPVKHLDPEEFAALYDDFGYGQALERDATTLSYLAEPAPGLWLLALDATDRSKNLASGEPGVDGRISAETAHWIVGVLERARAERKALIALVHHGLVAHFASQEKHAGEYLIDDAPAVSRLLASAGVRVAFTGHFHSNDIALQRWDDGSFLYDVETGSLVTWPCPLRFVRIDETGRMGIRTARVESLPSFEERRVSFAAYAREVARASVREIATDAMLRLGMRAAEVQALAGQIADAMVAHYAGDERLPEGSAPPLQGLSLMGRIVVGSRARGVGDLWNDTEPADNAIDIWLDSGAWVRAPDTP